MLNTLRFAEVCDLTLRSMPSCDCSSCTMHTLLHFFQSILFKVWICAESEHAWQPWHHLGLFIIQVELRLITPAGPGLPNVAAVEIVYLQALRWNMVKLERNTKKEKLYPAIQPFLVSILPYFASIWMDWFSSHGQIHPSDQIPLHCGPEQSSSSSLRFDDSGGAVKIAEVPVEFQQTLQMRKTYIILVAEAEDSILYTSLYFHYPSIGIFASDLMCFLGSTPALADAGCFVGRRAAPGVRSVWLEGTGSKPLWYVLNLGWSGCGQFGHSCPVAQSTELLFIGTTHAIFAKAMRHRCRSREQDHCRANTATTRGELDNDEQGLKSLQVRNVGSSPIAEVWSPEKGNWIYRIYRRTQFYIGYIPTTTHTHTPFLTLCAFASSRELSDWDVCGTLWYWVYHCKFFCRNLLPETWFWCMSCSQRSGRS